MVVMDSCDGCGFVYASVPVAEIGSALRHYATEIVARLSLGNDTESEWETARRQRATPDRWSAVEYAGHVLDILDVQHRRAQQALAVDLLDCVSEGIVARVDREKYNDRDVLSLRSAIAEASLEIAELFDGMSPEQTERDLIYHWPTTATRTLAWLGQHTVHELRHHLGDIDEAVAGHRFDPTYSGDERSTLLAWLAYHRSTLASKCAGLDIVGMRQRPVATSTLSLVGLLRHMAEVERFWFTEMFLGYDVEDLYCSRDDPDGDFDNSATSDPGDALAVWHRECRSADRVIGDCRSLDHAAVGERQGHSLAMRWILTHMIEEYARHNGHADLLRELIDGTTGE